MCSCNDEKFMNDPWIANTCICNTKNGYSLNSDETDCMLCSGIGASVIENICECHYQKRLFYIDNTSNNFLKVQSLKLVLDEYQ